jgi:hypothetical protein
MVVFLLFIVARIPILSRRYVCTGILRNLSIVLDDVDLVNYSEHFCALPIPLPFSSLDLAGTLPVDVSIQHATM